MTDSVLDSAVARLEAARSKERSYAEKAKAAAEDVRRLEDFVRIYQELTGVSGRVLPPLERSAPSTGGTITETEAASIEILRATGHPLHTRNLLQALLERGLEVAGQDPVSTLSARLSRASKLKNIRGQGWWMKDSADDADPEQVASSAVETPSAPVEPGEEVAHEIDDIL